MKNIYILFHTFNFQIYTSNGILYVDSETMLLIVGKLLLSSLLFAYTGLNCLKVIAIRLKRLLTSSGMGGTNLVPSGCLMSTPWLPA